MDGCFACKVVKLKDLFLVLCLYVPSAKYQGQNCNTTYYKCNIAWLAISM